MRAQVNLHFVQCRVISCQQPEADSRQPRIGARESGAGSQQPTAGSREPRIGTGDWGFGIREPGAETGGSGLGARGSGVGSRQPAAAPHQPPRAPISFRYLLSASFQSGSLLNPALSSLLLSRRLFKGRTALVG